MDDGSLGSERSILAEGAWCGVGSTMLCSQQVNPLIRP